jgi:hypothetical protein
MAATISKVVNVAPRASSLDRPTVRALAPTTHAHPRQHEHIPDGASARSPNVPPQARAPGLHPSSPRASIDTAPVRSVLRARLNTGVAADVR